MGVYINMEMPKSCIKCKLCVSYKCVLTGEIRWSDEFDYDSKRFENCPLVPVLPHGRTIDADALIREFEITEEDYHSGAALLMAVFLEVLKSAPTIIPAELEEEGET